MVASKVKQNTPPRGDSSSTTSRTCLTRLSGYSLFTVGIWALPFDYWRIMKWNHERGYRQIKDLEAWVALMPLFQAERDPEDPADFSGEPGEKGHNHDRCAWLEGGKVRVPHHVLGAILPWQVVSGALQERVGQCQLRLHLLHVGPEPMQTIRNSKIKIKWLPKHQNKANKGRKQKRPH